MERWKVIPHFSKEENSEQKPGRVTLGTRRAFAIFLLIVGIAALLVAAISRILN